MSHYEAERRHNARVRAFLYSQVEDTRDNLVSRAAGWDRRVNLCCHFQKRLAYVLGARQKAGDTLNQQELDFLKEQDIERRVLEKLEKMIEKVDSTSGSKRVSHCGERVGGVAVVITCFFIECINWRKRGVYCAPFLLPCAPRSARIFASDCQCVSFVGGRSHHLPR